MDFNKKSCEDLCEKLANEEINTTDKLNVFLTQIMLDYTLMSESNKSTRERELKYFKDLQKNVFESAEKESLGADYNQEHFEKDAKSNNSESLERMNKYITYLKKLSDELHKLEKQRVKFFSIFMGVGTAKFYRKAANKIKATRDDCRKTYLKKLQKNNAQELCDKLITEVIIDAQGLSEFIEKKYNQFKGQDNQARIEQEKKVLKKVYEALKDRPENYVYKETEQDQNKLEPYTIYLDELKGALNFLSEFKNPKNGTSIFVGEKTSKIYKEAANKINSRIEKYQKMYSEKLQKVQDNQENNAQELCDKLITEVIIDAQGLSEFIEEKYKQFEGQDEQQEKEVLKKVYEALKYRPKDYVYKDTEQDSEKLELYTVYLQELKETLDFLANPKNLRNVKSIFVDEKTSKIYKEASNDIDTKFNACQDKLSSIAKQPSATKQEVTNPATRRTRKETTNRKSNTPISAPISTESKNEQELNKFFSNNGYKSLYETLKTLYNDEQFREKVLKAELPENDANYNELRAVKFFFEWLSEKINNTQFNDGRDFMLIYLTELIPKNTAVNRAKTKLQNACDAQIEVLGMLNYKTYEKYTPTRPVPKELEKEKKLQEYLGIQNFGNTCYLATALQDLFYYKKFREKVLSADLTDVSESDQNSKYGQLMAVQFFFKYLKYGKETKHGVPKYDQQRYTMAKMYLNHQDNFENSAQAKSYMEQTCREQMRLLKNAKLLKEGNESKGPRGGVTDVKVKELEELKKSNDTTAWLGRDTQEQDLNNIATSRRNAFIDKLQKKIDIILRLYQDREFKEKIDQIKTNQIKTSCSNLTRIKKLFELINKSQLYSNKEGFKIIKGFADNLRLDQFKETILNEIQECNVTPNRKQKKTRAKHTAEPKFSPTNISQEWKGLIDTEYPEKMSAASAMEIMDQSNIIKALYENEEFKNQVDSVSENELNLKTGYENLEKIKILFDSIKNEKYYTTDCLNIIASWKGAGLDSIKNSVLNELRTLRGSKKSRGLSADSTIHALKTAGQTTIEEVLKYTFKELIREKAKYRLPLKNGNRFAILFADRPQNSTVRGTKLEVTETLDLTNLVKPKETSEEPPILEFYSKGKPLLLENYKFKLISASIGTGTHYYLYRKKGEKWKIFDDNTVEDRNWEDIKRNIENQCETLTYKLM